MINYFFATFEYLFQKLFVFLDTTLFSVGGFSVSLLDLFIGFFVLYIIVDNFVPKA